MAKLVVGINDLATLHPEVAAEADGWDPANLLASSQKKMPWKCNKGHRWEASTYGRTTCKYGCPYCTNRKVWAGFNDLATHFPEIAKEADGWDPTEFLPQSNKRMSWICSEGHRWETQIYNRTGNKSLCPYCSGKKAIKGVNDLKTLFPEIAKEADGWDPSEFLSQSNKKQKWKCSLGHRWEASIDSRRKTGCPYCSGNKPLKGFNTFLDYYPEQAKEADGWDPSTVTFGSKVKKQWKCKLGHTWMAQPYSRKKSGCPYCSNKKVLVGFNDLQTQFPEIAKEADGWDPSTCLAGSHSKMKWVCCEGHRWTTVIKDRTLGGNGCPSCAEHGFNPNKPAVFYLLKREGEQQLGITNDFPRRMKEHSLQGWVEVDKSSPHSGQEVLDVETAFRKWLRKEVGLIKDKKEDWSTKSLEVHSLAELKEKSGIETSIF